MWVILKVDKPKLILNVAGSIFLQQNIFHYHFETKTRGILGKIQFQPGSK